MESIAEGMGDATLRTPESHAVSQGMANPNDEEEKEADAKERLTELGWLQSRLPFVPQCLLSLDGVTDEEKMEWIPNLRSIIVSEVSKVTYENLQAIAGREKLTEDGSGPIALLDLSQVVLMWGSTWEKAVEATSMD
eukprot:1921723-Rhodomonas_salina.2